MSFGKPAAAAAAALTPLALGCKLQGRWRRGGDAWERYCLKSRSGADLLLSGRGALAGSRAAAGAARGPSRRGGGAARRGAPHLTGCRWHSRGTAGMGGRRRKGPAVTASFCLRLKLSQQKGRGRHCVVAPGSCGTFGPRSADKPHRVELS